MKSSVTSALAGIPVVKTGYMYNEIKNKILSGKTVSKWDIDTPALVLDLDAFEKNLSKMSEYCKNNNILLRPHAKTHKCTIIAQKQMSTGAMGICTAKISEAEAMAEGGIEEILVTSPIITDFKIKRLINIRKRTDKLMVVVDTIENAQSLSDAASSTNSTLDILIDINPPGMDRTGISPGKPALDLAKFILQSPGLHFRGIQSYAGNMQHVEGFNKRRERNLKVMEAAAETKDMMEKEGIEVEFFSGGGTGTYNIDHHLPGFTDVQVGSYIFMDVEYRAIGGQNSDECYEDFEPSLMILTTAISQPVKGKITVDAGKKTLATDGPLPEVKDSKDILFRFRGDEHGELAYENSSTSFKVGDKIELIAPHCDPTVNLYDHFYCVRNDLVEDIWEISARGMSQ